MRFLLYLFLFFILYYIVRMVIKSLSSSSKTTINNSRVKRKESKYDDVEDAKFTEIKSDEEKGNNQ